MFLGVKSIERTMKTRMRTRYDNRTKTRCRASVPRPTPRSPTRACARRCSVGGRRGSNVCPGLRPRGHAHLPSGGGCFASLQPVPGIQAPGLQALAMRTRVACIVVSGLERRGGSLNDPGTLRDRRRRCIALCLFSLTGSLTGTLRRTARSRYIESRLGGRVAGKNLGRCTVGKLANRSQPSTATRVVVEGCERFEHR